jgi:sugar lactone lactonase YvrE
MKNILTAVTLLLASNLYAQHSLDKIWQSDTILRTPESVLYDAGAGILYVSNMNSATGSKKESGFISKVDLNGKMIKSDFITGLDGPKGLGRYKNLLYVAEMTEVSVIDIDKDMVVQRIPVEEAQLLNDITVDSRGIVYVSDTKTNKVHRIENGKPTVYLENMKSANGVLAVGTDLYVLTNGSLQKADANKNLTTVADGMDPSTDGIEMVKENEFIVSCWIGIVYYVKTDGSKQVLFDTREQKINSADIGYDAKNKIVYVPTFFKNSIYAYKLK